jgi:outer membrane protein TolC
MRYLMVALGILLPLSTQARDLTLDQALKLAEAHSFALKKSEAASEAAQSAVQAARADRLPTVSASAMTSYISYIPTLDLQLPGFPPISRDIGIHDNYQADLRMALPLYSGGRISNSIGLANANSDLYGALRAASRDQLDYATRLEYYTLYRSDRMLDVAKASLTRAQTINKDAQSLYAAGAADSVSLLDASLALSQADFSVRQAEIARRTAELRLLIFLGLDPSDTLRLIDSLTPPSEQTWSVAVDTSKPELRVANASVSLAKRRFDLSKSDYFPTISAFGGYSYGRPNIDRFNNTWNGYFTVGASLSWSFNLGGRTHYNRNVALHNIDAASYDRDQTAENLSREARLAVEQLKLAYAKYINANDQYRISSDNYRLATAQHRDGALSSNRLVTIESELTAAQASLSAAVVDYYMAQSAYYYAIGSPELGKGK